MESFEIDVIDKDEEKTINLLEVFESFFNSFTSEAEEILNSDTFQNISGIAADLSQAIKGITLIKKVCSIPNIIFMNKFEKFCRGLADIPIEKRQKYLSKVGKRNFNKESVFIFTVINKIEEVDKIDFFLKLLSALLDEKITHDEYRRLIILTNSNLYSDILYLKEHITSNPVKLTTDSDYGLVAGGLLVTAGSEWFERKSEDENDTGIRFNYTMSAKKWQIYSLILIVSKKLQMRIWRYHNQYLRKMLMLCF